MIFIFTRFKSVVTYLYVSPLNEVKVIETASFKKGDYKAILGFAGAGFIGNTSVMFITRSKGLKLIGHLKSY